MPIVILVFAFLLAITVQFLPLLGGDSLRPYLQAMAGVAAFFIGMTQSTFGRYMADAMTDRRRAKEKQDESVEHAERKSVRFSPLLQMIRNCLNGSEEKFNNDYDVILMPGDLVFGGGAFLKVNAAADYERLKTMVNRLNTSGDLTITKRDTSYTRFRLSDELYAQILDFAPDA